MNAFELFSTEPRLLLDEEALQVRFHELRKGCSGEKEAQQVNVAYQTLTSLKMRLHELLKQEGVVISSAVDRVPSDLADLFMIVGSAFRQTDALLKKSEEVSELERALLAEDFVVQMDDLQQVAGKLRGVRKEMDAHLALLDERWVSSDHDVEGVQGLMLKESFLSKWEQQVEEKLFLVGQLL